ncbi:MAG: hypothetical protein LC789_18105 [Actinobacteria bacterium]|nr:hypothetical protein [Actinomycetota bacterium]
MSGQVIAVIEDEQAIATAVAARLRTEGFRVEIASDGPGGVELCKRVRHRLDEPDPWSAWNLSRSRARVILEATAKGPVREGCWSRRTDD